MIFRLFFTPPKYPQILIFHIPFISSASGDGIELHQLFAILSIYPAKDSTPSRENVRLKLIQPSRWFHVIWFDEQKKRVNWTDFLTNILKRMKPRQNSFITIVHLLLSYIQKPLIYFGIVCKNSIVIDSLLFQLFWLLLLRILKHKIPQRIQYVALKNVERMIAAVVSLFNFFPLILISETHLFLPFTA